MALIVRNKVLNEDITIAEGYVRIMNIQYNSTTAQPLYSIALYTTKNDREKEKAREAILLKYKNSQTLNEYLTSIVPQLNENTLFADVEKSDKAYGLVNRILSGKSMVLGTAKQKQGFLSNDLYNEFKAFLLENNLFSEAEIDADILALKQEIEIPYAGDIGGEVSVDYNFNNGILARAYGELKAREAPLLADSEDDL